MPSLKCINCQAEFSPTERLYTCPHCAGLLDVAYDLTLRRRAQLTGLWDARRASSKAIDQSGGWRFRELLPEADENEIVTLLEGNTQVWEAPRSADYAGMERLVFKHLGMNP